MLKIFFEQVGCGGHSEIGKLNEAMLEEFQTFLTSEAGYRVISQAFLPYVSLSHLFKSCVTFDIRDLVLIQAYT